MTTLAELADRAQNQIADSTASNWTQDIIEAWCVEGIRDYSQHLPRVLSHDIAATAGERKYILPAGFRSMLSVEYPAGQEPPHYLTWLSFADERFWRSVDYYDVVERDDASQQDELWLSAAPAAGETVTIIYKGDHEFDLENGDTITVPARHEHIIIDFVMWRAWLELLGAEQQSPTSNSSLLMSQYASNADRAKRQYVETLARALRSEEAKSARVHWRLDKWDRIY